MGRSPVTPQGYARLREKLEYLQHVELPKQEKALGEAREKGDLAENSEFDAAREHVWEVERQIGDLQALISDAEVQEVPRDPPGEVCFGVTVRVRNLTRGKEECYHIVGVGEGDIERGRISFMSPIGQGLIGKKVGVTFEVQVPAGTFRYEVLEIRCLEE